MIRIRVFPVTVIRNYFPVDSWQALSGGDDLFRLYLSNVEGLNIVLDGNPESHGRVGTYHPYR